jgi:uncharacterized protein
MQDYFNQSYVRALVALVLLCLIFALGAYAQATLKHASYGPMGPTTISVSGEGEVFATPDIGEFSFSVRAEGADATTAQRDSATAINAIYGYLKDEGVEEKDIKTEGYNLWPKYRFEERICVSGSFCPPGNQVLDGYEVTQTIRVKVRNLDGAPALISGVGEKGATDISNLNFTIDDESLLIAEARTTAIADAQAKATATADALGVKLVKMVGYYEDSGQKGIPYGLGGMERSVMMDMAESAPALPVGENTIRQHVTLIYEIR